jgi:hypothetical protein
MGLLAMLRGATRMAHSLLVFPFGVQMCCLPMVVRRRFVVTSGFVMSGALLGISATSLAAHAADFLVKFPSMLRRRCLAAGLSGLPMLLGCSPTFHKRCLS